MKQKEVIYLRDKKQCQYCGIGLAFKESTLDHIIPKRTLKDNRVDNVDNLPPTVLNPTTPDNLKLCCRYCNTDKANLTLDEFRQVILEKARDTPKDSPNYRRYQAMTRTGKVLFHFEQAV